MNKRPMFMLIIVFVLFGVCFVEQILLTNYLSSVQNSVKELVEFVGDKNTVNNQEIYEKVVELANTWSGYEQTLCFLVNLKDIEDVGIEITKMKVYVVEDNVAEFKASLALMLYYIDGYYKFFGISFENIF